MQSTRTRSTKRSLALRILICTSVLFLSFWPLVASASTPAPERFESRGNPILGDGSYYSADGATLSHEGKLYIYFGNDRPDRWVGGFVMPEYGILATEDPGSGDWELYRKALVPDRIFKWATGKNCFASHVERGPDGRFYWFTPVEWKGREVHDRMAIGVAVSDTPVGPWKDAIGKPLVTWKDVFGERRRGTPLIDPTILQDDDGQVYMYWGTFWAAYVVKLAPSLTETIGENVRVRGWDGFFEAPWVFKRSGTYYMLYDWKVGGSEWTPSNYQAAIGYATAPSPMGPWAFQGIILHRTSATTVHPSMIEHDGQWWITYHTRDAKGGGHFRRSISIDEVEWDGDRILPVEQTWANPPRLRLTRNVAHVAKSSASYSEEPPMTIWALNDGVPDTATLPPDFWSSYRGNQSKVESDWVRYDWPEPVRIDGVGLWFNEDRNWHRPPQRWLVEYLDASGEWQAVDVDEYPSEARKLLVVSFPPVATTAIRATLWGRPNAESKGEYIHSVSLAEFEVYARQADRLKDPAVRTRAGQAPELPGAVDAWFGRSMARVPVSWHEVPDGAYEEPGKLTVRGWALGQAGRYVEATVTVE